MEINERIKLRRVELGLTLEDVADKLGVAKSTISRYETRDIKNMGIDKIEELAKVLKCSPSYLMGWHDDPEFEQVEIKTIAAHAIEGLSEDQVKKVIEFAKFIKSQQNE